jgi:hypothetical protein
VREWLVSWKFAGNRAHHTGGEGVMADKGGGGRVVQDIRGPVLMLHGVCARGSSTCAPASNALKEESFVTEHFRSTSDPWELQAYAPLREGRTPKLIQHWL